MPSGGRVSRVWSVLLAGAARMGPVEFPLKAVTPETCCQQRPSGVFTAHCNIREANVESDVRRAVTAALSQDRLEAYKRSAGGGLDDAIKLYEWNLTVSGAFFEALGVVKVALRNALSTQLERLHDGRHGHWYDDPTGLLRPEARRDIHTALSRLEGRKRPATPGRVVAELTFGFWKYLLAKTYESTLWTPALRHAFPNLRPQTRRTAYRTVNRLHALRNRIAHHEPIHRRDLQADTQAIDCLLSWIDADLRDWADQRLSRIRTTLTQRPHT